MTNKRKEYMKKYQREWVAKRRAEYFKDKYCVKCNSIENLELDHIDYKQKEHHKIWSWHQERREKELEKCQVLCNKCHMNKTIEERKIRFPQIHGTQNSYVRGCRCKECKTAHSISTTEWVKNNRIKIRASIPTG